MSKFENFFSKNNKIGKFVSSDNKADSSKGDLESFESVSNLDNELQDIHSDILQNYNFFIEITKNKDEKHSALIDNFNINYKPQLEDIIDSLIDLRFQAREIVFSGEESDVAKEQIKNIKDNYKELKERYLVISDAASELLDPIYEDNKDVLENKNRLEKKEVHAEKLSWKEKLMGVATNPELYKQIIKTSTSAAASILGVKSFYDVPSYMYQRFQVRGVLRNFEGSAIDGLGGAVKDLIVSTESDSDKEDFYKNLKTFHKKLNLTKEGVEKGSLQRKELARILKEFRRNKDTDKKEDFDEIYADVQNVLDNYTNTKVTGITALKESMNSALTFSGAFGFRGIVYTGLEAWERKHNLEKKNKQNNKQEKVSWWKDVIKSGVVETFESARLKGGEQDSKKKKIFKAIKSYGHIARFLGIGTTAVFDSSNYSEGIDKMLNMMSGSLSGEEVLENIKDKADIFNLKDNKDDGDFDKNDILINQKSQLNREIDISGDLLTDYELQELKKFKLADNLVINDKVIDVLNSDIDNNDKEKLLINPNLIEFYLESDLPEDLLKNIIADNNISEIEKYIIYNDQLDIDEKTELLKDETLNIEQINNFIEEKNSIKFSVEKGSNFTNTIKKALQNANPETKIAFIDRVREETDFSIKDFDDNYSDKTLNEAINYLSTQAGKLPENKVSDLVYEGDIINVNKQTGDWTIIRNNDYNLEKNEELNKTVDKDAEDKESQEKITRLETKKAILKNDEEIKNNLKYKDSKVSKSLTSSDENIGRDVDSDRAKQRVNYLEQKNIDHIDLKEKGVSDLHYRDSKSLYPLVDKNEDIGRITETGRADQKLSELEQKNIDHIDLKEEFKDNITGRSNEKLNSQKLDVTYDKHFLIINNTVIPNTFSNYTFSDNPDNYQDIANKWLDLSEAEKNWYYNFNDNLDLYKSTDDANLKSNILKEFLQIKDLKFNKNIEDNSLESEYRGNTIFANNKGIVVNNGDLLEFNVNNLKNLQKIISINRSDLIDDINHLESEYAEQIQNNNINTLDKLDTRKESYLNLNWDNESENISLLKEDFNNSIETSVPLDLKDQIYFRDSLLDKIKSQELKIPKNGYVVIVDRAESGQTMSLFHYNKDEKQLSLIGSDIVSTANPDKYEGSETPLGIHYINRVGKAEIWGEAYGDPGHEIYDISVESGPAFHPTNEEKLLGNRASHGCIRMTDQLNDYLDKHKILSVGSPVVVVEKPEFSKDYASK